MSFPYVESYEEAAQPVPGATFRVRRDYIGLMIATSRASSFPLATTGRYVAAVFLSWVPLAIAVTLLCGVVYAAVQQSYRQGANDPQVQMATDAATALGGGQPASAVVPAAKVQMASSLAPYLIVYDDAGRVVAASVELNGATPPLPPGVLDAARARGEDRVTWQPASAVRSAAVVVRYGGAQPGFVLAGRSLREVEARVDQLTLMIGAAWVITLGATLAAVAVSVAIGMRWLRAFR